MNITELDFPGTLTDEHDTGPSLDDRLANLLSPVVKTVSPLDSKGRKMFAVDGMSTQRHAEVQSPTLSNSHIGPSLEFAANATYAKLIIPGEKCSQPPPKRGTITDFSNKSQKRMRDMLNQCDRTRLSRYWYFCTLTYPAFFPRNRREWRAHYRAFTKRLRRRYNIQAIIWKLEPQKRLAPHYHLLIFSEDEIDNSVVAEMWTDCTGSNDPKHLAWHLGELGNGNTPCLSRVKSWNGVKSYCAKYCEKTIEGGDLPTWWHGGRWWGLEGELPITKKTIQMTPREGFDVHRMMRKLYKAKTGKRFRTEGLRGITLYCEDSTTKRIMEHASKREQERLAAGDWSQPALSHYREKAAQGLRFGSGPDHAAAAALLSPYREQKRLEYYGVRHKNLDELHPPENEEHVRNLMEIIRQNRGQQ